MRNYAFVGARGTADDAHVSAWVNWCAGQVARLPPKPARKVAVMVSRTPGGFLRSRVPDGGSGTEHPTVRFDGILKSWNDDRGFGFIEPVQGGQEVFVHIKSFSSRDGRPQVNQPLSFEVEVGPQGRKRARNVQVIRPRTSRRPSERQRSAQWGPATLLALPGFLLGSLAVVVLWKPPLWFAGVYLAMSLVTFGVYAADKSAAARAASRTPENVLHALALAGGWPGALLAQQVLRHKSTKAAFRSVFWATVVLNCIGFALLCSPIGRPLWAP